MSPAASQTVYLAEAAEEYCRLIGLIEQLGCDREWRRRMQHLLPRLHMAVISRQGPEEALSQYVLPDDEARFELYIRLHAVLHADPLLWSVLDEFPSLNRVCDQLADDLTDIYFDLKQGLDLLAAFPAEPERAMAAWLCSFYGHWSRHLLDAEHWLHWLGGRESAEVAPLWCIVD